MQTQSPVKKKRVLYRSIFVVIISILIIVRIILHYIPVKPAAVLTDIKNTPSVSNFTENPTSQIVSVSEKKDATPSSMVSETFRLTAGAAKLSLPVTGGSLLSILTAAKDRGEITFYGKEYTGIGFFVTELGSLKEEDGKYLMYYINGKEASVGVSIYIPKTDDVVVWKLK